MRRVRVTKEWQDRMIKRGRTDFDLAPLDQLTMFTHDRATNLPLLGDQGTFVIFRKMFSSSIQLRDKGIMFSPVRVEPGQVKPNLQVSPILFFKVSLRPR